MLSFSSHSASRFPGIIWRHRSYGLVKTLLRMLRYQLYPDNSRFSVPVCRRAAVPGIAVAATVRTRPSVFSRTRFGCGIPERSPAFSRKEGRPAMFSIRITCQSRISNMRFSSLLIYPVIANMGPRRHGFPSSSPMHSWSTTFRFIPFP